MLYKIEALKAEQDRHVQAFAEQEAAAADIVRNEPTQDAKGADLRQMEPDPSAASSASAGDSFFPTSGFATFVHHPNSLVHLCVFLAKMHKDSLGVIVVVDIRHRDVFF